jgi:putative ABC transport system ATP-binding protein
VFSLRSFAVKTPIHMLEFRNISLKAHKQMLLTDAELQVRRGDKAVVRGPSGCGKSSLLKCAVGAIPLEEGEVRIEGVILKASTVTGIRSRIAFIGQEPVLGTENVRDALLLPFRFKAHQDSMPAASRIEKVLERLRLPGDILSKPCSRISGGEKQRIVIARALLLNKSIFLADEVTSALDPESTAAVIGELFDPEITLLSVSHDPDWIKTCDRVIDFDNGQLREVAA